MSVREDKIRSASPLKCCQSTSMTSVTTNGDSDICEAKNSYIKINYGNALEMHNNNYNFHTNHQQLKKHKFPKRPPANLIFDDITYDTWTWSMTRFRREKKHILHGVSGVFKSGELSTIMGPSGAGKTTLLNVLAGFITRGSSGVIRINETVRDQSERFRKLTAYIPQEEQLRLNLTALEAMTFAAHLKLGYDLSKEDKIQQITELLEMLGLEGCHHTITSRLSGGQRKRLAIALELISNPPILFLDEPTTGLDSLSCSQCVSLLKRLAQEGRTIICTIHQPSALIFEMFDQLYALADGKCIFQGPANTLVPHFASVGLQCPSYHNPADFLMEVSVGEYDRDLDKLASIATLSKTQNLATKDVEILATTENSIEDPDDVTTVPASIIMQFIILYQRNFLCTRRNYIYLFNRLAAHIFIGFLFGYLYKGVGKGADTALANYVYLYGTLLLIVYTGKMSVTLSFPLEMQILKREHFNRWYRLTPYLCSVLLLEIPFQILCTWCYIAISYWLTEQPLDFRLYLFLMFCTLCTLCAQAWGYFIGATTPIKIAVFIGPVLACLFSVFGFCIRYYDTPIVFRWMFHISYYRAGFQGRRKILRQVNGTFKAGDLTAIMGPSGCGKTTLMNLLAGYTVAHVEGELLTNNEKRDEAVFKKQMCYIMQEDHLQPLLTVNEAMSIAASLKLTEKISDTDKKTKIQEALEAIGLGECCDTRTGLLSGGQKKRLSIALELLRNPQVMFFDEPTSGLDSSTSKQCIMLLKQLTEEGRTVICTIHQPSALLFELFDHLYAIAEGRCIYQGSIKGMLPYLEDLGLRCPPYHNPADYLLEVANEEHGSFNKELVIKSENGKCEDWRKQKRDTLQLQSVNHIDAMMNSGLITPVKAPPIFFPNLSRSISKNSYCYSTKYPTSSFNQVIVLIKRSFLILSRDKTLTYSRIFTHFSAAIFLGILYFGIGTDAKDLQNNANFLFFTIMFLMLTAFNCVTLTFPTQVALISKEHFNSWYSIASYYFSLLISDFPIQLIATLSYAIVTFFMTCQPTDGFRIVYFLIICILISLVAQSFGMLIGSSWEMKTAIIIGPICFLPFTIFSGFFVQFHDAHPYAQWIFHTSYLKYGFEGLMLAVLGYDREKLPCSADYCHIRYPQQFLNQMDMGDAVYSHCVYFLIGICILFRVATYFVLLSRVNKR